MLYILSNRIKSASVDEELAKWLDAHYSQLVADESNNNQYANENIALQDGRLNNSSPLTIRLMILIIIVDSCRRPRTVKHKE